MPGVHVAPPLSPQDLLRLQDEPGLEFVNGQIVEKPVSIESVDVEGQIYFLLRSAIAQTKSARVFTSGMGYRCFADDPLKFRKPDVSIVRTERLRGFDGREGFITFPPD